MKITIIPADGAVYKDGYSFSGLSFTKIPDEIHALQWDGSSGWIEFVSDENGGKPQNENISELPAWVDECLSVWYSAKSAEDEAIKNQTDSVNIVS